MAKTLNDFKQQVAEKYDTILLTTKQSDEAAELYAEYLVTQMEEAEEAVYNRGWNEALKWAVNQLDSGDIHFTMTPYEQRQAILNGLK